MESCSAPAKAMSRRHSGDISAVREVAGSPFWIAQQCGPDEAGTASILQGSVSRPTMKDLSDANRSVNRLKQTANNGTHIHVEPLDDLRTAAVSGAALGLGQT